MKYSVIECYTVCMAINTLIMLKKKKKTMFWVTNLDA